MAGTVLLHVLAHSFVEHLAVFGQIHVDEVDDDDSAHVAQPQLAGEFVGGAEIGVERVLFLCFLLRPVPAVHVHDVHGLRVFDAEVAAVSVVDGLSETGLDLLRHVEVVEDRHLAVVLLHDARLFRGY